MGNCQIHPANWNPVFDEDEQCKEPASKYVSFRWKGKQCQVWMCDFHYNHWKMQSYFEDFGFFENVVW